STRTLTVLFARLHGRTHSRVGGNPWYVSRTSSAMLKTSRRIFFLVLVAIGLISGCGGGGGTSTPSTSPVLVFSDVHFDPFYDQTIFPQLVAAPASEWASIFQTSHITTLSVSPNDTNYPLLVLALSSIRQNLGASPLVIFPGDILSHGFDKAFYAYSNIQTPTAEQVTAMQTFSDKTVAFFMEQVRLSVGNIPVMFAVGNNDSYADIGPEPLFLSNTAELFYSKFLNGSVDHQEFLATFTNGGYYAAEPAGTNLMVIGLNTVQISTIVTPDVILEDTQLAWFESRLALAKAAGKKVWLLMHVPPGTYPYKTSKLAINGKIDATSAQMTWQANYQDRFLQLLANYPGVVAMIFAGHTHMDEYRILPSSEAVEISPSISPRSGNNPAYKVFTFSPDSLQFVDYSALNYSLASNPQPEQFANEYTFLAGYSMPGLLANSLAQLWPELATNMAKQTLFRESYSSGSAFKPMTDANWQIFWCGIGKMGVNEFVSCVNGT
ncbi:metallophosphoesterase, partial [Propionivibrio sp.]|uniref:metallophosphoesterase n=1 Tax=Propionivibrio sp. TaxID=2212460 RepID=UPI003BF14D4D